MKFYQNYFLLKKFIPFISILSVLKQTDIIIKFIKRSNKFYYLEKSYGASSNGLYLIPISFKILFRLLLTIYKDLKIITYKKYEIILSKFKNRKNPFLAKLIFSLGK